jgi:hypothetical protein
MRKRPYRIRIEPWSAVRLVTQGESCSRATATASQRLLAREAPALPLKGCTRAAVCNCMYRHYNDRRAGPRRDEDRSGGRTQKAPLERRGIRDRRGPS